MRECEDVDDVRIVRPSLLLPIPDRLLTRDIMIATKIRIKTVVAAIPAMSMAGSGLNSVRLLLIP